MSEPTVTFKSPRERRERIRMGLELAIVMSTMKYKDCEVEWELV